MVHDKKAQLADFVGDLSEEQVNCLARAVELKRLHGEDASEEQFILDSMRAILAQSLEAPERVMVPQRIFCLPFEDLLVRDRAQKEFCRIERSSLNPIWSWLCEDLLPDSLPEMEQQVRQHLLNDDQANAYSLIAQMQAQACEAIFNSLADCTPGTEAYEQLAEHLGGSMVLEDARDLASVLYIAPEVLSLLAELPRPMLSITDHETNLVRDTYAKLCDEAPDFAPLIFLVVMGRLEEPWVVLRLVRNITGIDSGEVFGPGPLGICGGLLLKDLQDITNFIVSAINANASAHRITENLAYFVLLMEGVIQESGIAEQSQWGQELGKLTDQVADAMELVIDRSVSVLRSALPSHNVSEFGAPESLRPDISNWPEQAAVEAAINHLILLDGTGVMAEKICLDVRRQAALNDVQDVLEGYIEKILEEIKAADGEARERAMAHAETAVLLTRYVFGEEKAEALRNLIAQIAA